MIQHPKPLIFLSITLFVLLACNIPLWAKQIDSAKHPSNKPTRHRYGIWYTPTGRSTVINGIAAGIIALPGRGQTLRVNGINIEANPIPVYGTVILTVGGIITGVQSIFTKRHYETNNDTSHIQKNPRHIFPNAGYEKPDTVFRTVVNGLSISTGMMTPESKMNGVAVNALLGFETDLNGLEVTGICSVHNCFKGVMISGIANIVSKGNGLQIALYNKCDNGKVFQIGLLNKIGKRTTPFINFRLRRSRAISPPLQNEKAAGSK